MTDLDRPGFSLNDLFRRGWSRGLIQKLLGEPDLIAPNPHYPNGASMKLYARTRVEAAEHRHEFQERQDRRRSMPPGGTE
jgi:hypothetical protein